jgi:hypothetical protein
MVRDEADGPRAHRGQSIIEGAVMEVRGLLLGLVGPL